MEREDVKIMTDRELVSLLNSKIPEQERAWVAVEIQFRIPYCEECGEKCTHGYKLLTIQETDGKEHKGPVCFECYEGFKDGQYQ